MVADIISFKGCHLVSNKRIPIPKRICDIKFINETFGSVIDGHTRHNNRITSAQNTDRCEDNGAKHLEENNKQINNVFMFEWT